MITYVSRVLLCTIELWGFFHLFAIMLACSNQQEITLMGTAGPIRSSQVFYHTRSLATSSKEKEIQNYPSQWMRVNFKELYITTEIFYILNKILIEFIDEQNQLNRCKRQQCDFFLKSSFKQLEWSKFQLMDLTRY